MEDFSMEPAHESVVEAQFGPRAKAYVESAVHARGPDLDALEAIVRAARPARALDVGAGGGHVAYLLARHAGSVTAADLSPEMLAAVAATARDKGLANVVTIEAPAERLPLDDGAFDFVASRYSTHHWRDFEGGLREARRVARAGARAVFVDAFAPHAALFDTHLQAVELLRDTSHVRDYSAGEWLSALARSGFAVEALKTFRIRMDYPVWIARMRTPEINARAIRALQGAASAETKAHFEIEPDGSFMLDVLLIEARAA
jgi:ubiquinone/menaquinone biosynthesis C-methylase UbiE